MDMGPDVLKGEAEKVITASGNLTSYLNRIKAATDNVKGMYVDEESSKYFQDVDDFYTQATKLLTHVESAGNYLKSVAIAAANISSGNG